MVELVTIINFIVIIIIIIIIIQNWSVMKGCEKDRFTPCKSEDPSPTIPTYRKKEEKKKNSRRYKDTS